MLIIPEILCHCKCCVPHSKTGAWGLVHLAENHYHVRENACSLHVTVKLLPFTTTLSNAAKYTHPLMMLYHVVNHLSQQHSLAHSSPSEKARFSAALKRHEHIYNLDTGLEYLGFCGPPCQRRRSSVYCAPFDI